jgi:biopolymer transport protein TolR
MAVQFTAGAGQGRSARSRRRRPPMSEINVTPLVDVMLVLLIVFMIAAPLLTVGVEVDLPQTDVPEVPGSDEPLAVSIDGEGRIFLQDTEIKIEELGPRLVAITQNNSEVRIFVRGDAAIDYGRVMTVMGTLNQAGFNNVALIARLPGTAAP